MLVAFTANAQAGSDLAKKTQNPVSDLISLPFQNNTNFGLGPESRTQNILNIQPVIPVKVGNWNLINRTIAPVVWQPDVSNSTGGDFGLGDINHTVFLSPANSEKIIWGAGPIVSLPTASNRRLGPQKLSVGPSVVVLAMPGNFVIGGLVNNLWSVAGKSDRPDVNLFTAQYFVNYNLKNGLYLVSAPILNANWEASGEKWTVPFGGGIGKIFRVGAQPFNAQVQGFWNAVKPEGGADSQLRVQIQLLFPKGAPKAE